MNAALSLIPVLAAITLGAEVAAGRVGRRRVAGSLPNRRTVRATGRLRLGGGGARRVVRAWARGRRRPAAGPALPDLR